MRRKLCMPLYLFRSIDQRITKSRNLAIYHLYVEQRILTLQETIKQEKNI